MELSWLPIRTPVCSKEKSLRSNSNHERESKRARELNKEKERVGEADKEDEEALVCISSYTTSTLKGTNTFVLSTPKVQTLAVQEAVLQRQQEEKASVLI